MNNTKVPHIYRTSQESGERLTQLPNIEFQGKGNAESVVEIDESKTFQVVEGFGGAFTESMSVTLDKMPPEKREEAIAAYFDREKGIGYNLCRTHINSCDFSLGNYAYAEVDGDVNLDHFDMSRDKKSLFPLIKESIKKRGLPIKLFASPWSPPAWMKTNGMMNEGGQLKPEYRSVWALYFSKYIKEMKKEGIDIWGVTIQNEPDATQRWDSCRYSGEEEMVFVRDFLGPQLKKDGLGDVKIIIWDHNKELVYERTKAVLSDPIAAKYVWGTGFHWYTGDHFDQLEKTHEAFPQNKLIFTEGCQEGGVKLGSWALGERYGHDIIGDLNNWTVGFTDWNMVLDEQGGPNHVGNFCDAPIIADTKTGKLHYQNAYYYIGHFSKFIQEGAIRIGCISRDERVEATAFKNPDASLAIVLMNRTENLIKVGLKVSGRSLLLELLAHSIITVVL